MTTATSPAVTDPSPPGPPPRQRPRRRWIAVVVLLLLAAAGVWWYLANAGYEATDDAFLAADVFAIDAKVAGRVVRVPVVENQAVAKGDLLAELETADYESRLAQADAAVAVAEARRQQAAIEIELVEAGTSSALRTAEAELAAARAQHAAASADLAAATAEAARAREDVARYEQLSERAVSPERLAAVRTTAKSAAAAEKAAQQRVESTQAEIAAAEARHASAQADRARVTAANAALQSRVAELAAARAAREAAALDLSYTRIVAPADGHVTRKVALPGTYVQPGQSLMAVVGTEVWVVANFKETQLERMAPGQPATVHVDAYDLDLRAHVQSIQSGSGAAFSLLPPENATGNYIKVVQRVPVKLVFDEQPPPRFVLGPGMSVVPEVDVR